LSGHENIIDGVREFERDLNDIFAERAPELQPKLKELLLELWLRGTKLGERLAKPTDNPNNGMHPTENFGPEIRLDEATGMMRALSEGESLVDLEQKLMALNPNILTPPPVPPSLEIQIDTIVQQNGGVVTNALRNMGVSEAYDLVPVVMNKMTGEVFGVDFPLRQKIRVASVTQTLLCSDGFGCIWDVPYGEGPPTMGDSYASHVVCRVNGEIKTSPTDYTILTDWRGGEYCIANLSFHSPLDSLTDAVELTYNTHTTEYF